MKNKNACFERLEAYQQSEYLNICTNQLDQLALQNQPTLNEFVIRASINTHF